eukprot:3903_1
MEEMSSSNTTGTKPHTLTRSMQLFDNAFGSKYREKYNYLNGWIDIIDQRQKENQFYCDPHRPGVGSSFRILNPCFKEEIKENNPSTVHPADVQNGHQDLSEHAIPKSFSKKYRHLQNGHQDPIEHAIPKSCSNNRLTSESKLFQ